MKFNSKYSEEPNCDSLIIREEIGMDNLNTKSVNVKFIVDKTYKKDTLKFIINDLEPFLLNPKH